MVKQANCASTARALWNEHLASQHLGEHNNVLTVECIDSPGDGIANEIAFPACRGGSFHELMVKALPVRAMLAQQNNWHNPENLPLFAPEQYIPAMLGLLKGMAHAHAKGIVHLDIKPPNAMLRAEGDFESAVLIDWGIALWIGTPLTVQCGTPGFTAPEIQALTGDTQHPLPVHPSQDVFSFGMLACQMLLGTSNSRILQYKGLGLLQPWLEAVYDSRLADTLSSALAADAQQRPTAQDMVDVFQTWRDILQLPPPPPPAALPPHSLALLTRARSAPSRVVRAAPPPPAPLTPAAPPQHAQGTHTFASPLPLHSTTSM